MDYLEILVKLRRLLRFVNMENKRIEKEMGLSIPQLLTLRFLCDQERFQATPTQIKEHLVLNASTVTGVVNRLEKKGLVAKVTGGHDRRSVRIVLTAYGRDLLQGLPSTAQDKLTHKLTSLSEDKLEELGINIDLLVNLLGAESIDAAALLMTDEINADGPADTGNKTDVA